MGNHKEPTPGPDGPPDVVGVEEAGAVAGNYGQAYPLGLQMAQGPHDGIVLHPGGQDVIAGTEEPQKGDIESLRSVLGENDTEGVADAEERRQGLPGLQDHPSRRQGEVMSGTAGTAADPLGVFYHGRCCHRRFRPGCGGMVEIDHPPCPFVHCHPSVSPLFTRRRAAKPHCRRGEPYSFPLFCTYEIACRCTAAASGSIC